LVRFIDNTIVPAGSDAAGSPPQPPSIEGPNSPSAAPPSASLPSSNSHNPFTKQSWRSRLHIPGFLKSRKFWIIFGISFATLVLIIAIPGYFFVIRPAQTVYSQLQITKADANKLKDAASIQDVVSADQDVDLVSSDLSTLKSRFSYFSWAANLPIASGYYSDGTHLLNAATDGLAAGKIITTSLLPFSDVLGLKGQDKTSTADQKLQKIVTVMPKIAPKTDDVAAKMALVNQEIQAIDPNHYPGQIDGFDIHQSLKSAQDLVKLVNEFMPQAKGVLTYAPTALGSSSPRTYMVLFQNDKELRPSGGFLTADTFATFDKGKLTTSKTDDIYNLDQSINPKPVAPAPILKYLPLVPKWNLRDTNLSPDFVHEQFRISLQKISSVQAKRRLHRR